jgi:2-polyprenyl-3-methyl-5-hydroxy-6-metoxy-1,4-benzoquinol methylase
LVITTAGMSLKLKSAPGSYDFEERTHCPVCRSARTKTLYASPFTQGAIGAFVADYYQLRPAVLSAAPYELVRCLDCRLVYQKWVGGTELLAELYGEWIDQHCPPDQDPQYRDQIGNVLQSRDGHEIMVAAAYLGLAPSGLVTLDYGMGWALWARIARELGCRSHGSDLSRSRMDYAREHGIATLDDDALGEPRFHFINTEQVMEHLAHPRETAERLAAALLPGGILKVSVPSAEKADAIVNQLSEGKCGGTIEDLMPVQPLEHVNSYSRYSLSKLAGILGLRIVQPGLATKYAFLRVRGAISPSHPRKMAKELVRPVYQFRSRRNLYVWMQKPWA